MVQTIYKINTGSANLSFEVDKDSGELLIEDHTMQQPQKLSNSEAIELIKVLAIELQKFQDSQPAFKFSWWPRSGG